MTTEQLALLADSRLSPGARILGLHLSEQAEGAWVEFGRDDARRLLGATAGKDRIARDLSDLVAFEHVEKRVGGKGHSDRYRFKRPENADAKTDSVGESRTLSAPSTTTPSTSSNAGVPEGGEKPRPGANVTPPTPAQLAPLREYLGEHAGAVDVFAASGPHSGSWPAALLGKYGPTGTRQDFWRGVAPERIPGIIADALLNYAQDFAGQPVKAPLFESVLTRARDGAPVKPPKIVPGTEHERIRSNGSYGETPGGSRFLRREGTGLGTLPELVEANLRKTAKGKAGAGATEEEVERVYLELAGEYARHHLQPTGS